MLKKFLAVAAFAVLASGALAQAQTLRGGDIAARTAGGEFRGYGRTQRSQLEDVIWRFRPDGTVTAVSQVRRRYAFTQGQTDEYTDTGRWRIEGERLCVAFESAHRAFSGCYAVEPRGGEHVRLGGPVQLEGTLGR